MNQYFTNDNNAVVSSERILYTASSFARSSLLHLQEIGKLTALKSHTSRREGLSSYLFFIVKNGAGTFYYDGKYYPLLKGSCVFIDCRKPYSHQPYEDNLWTLHWCHFFGPTLSIIYTKYTERGGRPVFTAEDNSPFFSVLEELMSVAKGSDYMRDMLINEHLSSLIRLIMENSWHPEDKALPSKKASVLEVKTYLDENYAKKISLDELASRFFINKYYLTKTFKEQFGQSITAYLLCVRITHAKQMLRFTDKTVEEIGISCGLGAPHYFSHVFKEVEGIPPSVYRKQW